MVVGAPWNLPPLLHVLPYTYYTTLTVQCTVSDCTVSYEHLNRVDEKHEKRYTYNVQSDCWVLVRPCYTLAPSLISLLVRKVLDSLLPPASSVQQSEGAASPSHELGQPVSPAIDTLPPPSFLTRRDTLQLKHRSTAPLASSIVTFHWDTEHYRAVTPPFDTTRPSTHTHTHTQQPQHKPQWFIGEEGHGKTGRRGDEGREGHAVNECVSTNGTKNGARKGTT